MEAIDDAKARPAELLGRDHDDRAWPPNRLRLGPSSARADLIVTTGMQPWETCASCHSLDGISAMARFPKLAGQRADYIAKQVRDFRDGRRQNDGGQMAAIAGDIDDENLAKSAAYFAGLPAPPPDASQPTGFGGLAARRGALSRRRRHRRHCRGAVPVTTPTGERADAPLLKAQHAAYLEKQLRDWRSGARHNDVKPNHAGDRRKAHRPRHRRACCVSRLAAAQPVECRAGAINCFSEKHREPTQHAGCWKRSETLSCRSVASHGDGSSDRFWERCSAAIAPSCTTCADRDRKAAPSIRTPRRVPGRDKSRPTIHGSKQWLTRNQTSYSSTSTTSAWASSAATAAASCAAPTPSAPTSSARKA